ncbi:hypothetical protein [Pseudooceanicola sp.]|uniref:DUF6902 family protein n=1 Tax=Pseudooceanicola sp. TaxID=1914328 RepID=UPI0035162EF5
MSNVIRLTLPTRRQSRQDRLATLVESFAFHRRNQGDVFWLKENAELLNILEATGEQPHLAALAPHQPFYADVEGRLAFFPQYYRFILSICLDLEDLGLPGTKGAALVDWAAREGLVHGELSDLQRAEARRLMLRRGVDPLPQDTGLDARLRGFIGRPATFAVPNRKAAYELTHIVFYLSDYGRRDPGLSAAALTSLEFAGILAFLDQNADLLAEICIALHYAGQIPSPIWEGWLARRTRSFAIHGGPQADVADDYHEYFVCNWALALSGRAAFDTGLPGGRMALRRAARPGPLRMISECLYRLDGRRRDDWQVMRPLIAADLDAEGHHILTTAEQSSDRFAAFFAGFARARACGMAQ